MSNTIEKQQTIAVIGATGGCVLNFTIRALQEGHTISAIARTPIKLKSLLQSKGITATQLNNLTIHEGNTKDVTSLTSALQINGRVVDTIVSGIGALPMRKPGDWLPGFEDRTICQVTAANIVKSLHSIRDSNPGTYKSPVLVAISTTGISEYGRDIPLLMVPLYHWLLDVPHEDKKVMERIVRDEGRSEGSVLGGFVIVRASLLWGENGVGIENLKVGVEEGEKPMPSQMRGYTITREDVGRWIYANLVRDEVVRGRYLNRCLGISS